MPLARKAAVGRGERAKGNVVPFSDQLKESSREADGLHVASEHGRVPERPRVGVVEQGLVDHHGCEENREADGVKWSGMEKEKQRRKCVFVSVVAFFRFVRQDFFFWGWCVCGGIGEEGEGV